jgi:DNA adenine methylase
MGVDIPNFLLCDINNDLISLYQHLVLKEQEFINDCRVLFCQENLASEAYYALRDEFNTSTDSYRKSCLFVFLNRHCFNGLMRYNASGLFNTPIGKYTSVHFPEKQMIFFANKFRNAEFMVSDFRTTFEKVVAGDFVYCDPPYVPIGKTTFTAYSKGGFSAEDQTQLSACCRKAADNGAVVVVSNHDTPESRDLYANADCIYGLNVKRTIGGKGSVRGDVGEVLVVYGAKPTGLFE